MANKLQLIIYRLSAFAPLCFVFAWVWYQQKKTPFVSVICLLIGLALILQLAFSFSYGKKHIAPVLVNITEITAEDKWLWGYTLSYILPFTSIVLSEFDLYAILAIAVTVALLVPSVNSASPNPLLFVRGYHFFTVKAENGIEYVLISKRQLRKSKDVKYVRRIFEYLLLDEVGE